MSILYTPLLLLSLFTILLTTFGVDGATRCYSCSGIANPHNCQKIEPCSNSQQCFTRSYISDVLAVKFDLGCQDKDFCNILSKRASLSQQQELWEMFTHKAMTSEEESLTKVRRKRQLEAPLCTECCDTDEHCNVELCRNSLVSRPPGRKCYDCGNDLVKDPSDCKTVRVCAPGQICHVSEQVSSGGSQFQVNCLPELVCKTIGNNILFGKRDRYLCRACCDSDHCNIDYCSRSRPLPTSLVNTTLPTTTPTTTTPTTTTMKIVPLFQTQSLYNVTREANSFPLSYQCQVSGLPAPNYTWEFVDSNGVSRNVDSKKWRPRVDLE